MNTIQRESVVLPDEISKKKEGLPNKIYDWAAIYQSLGKGWRTDSSLEGKNGLLEQQG